MRTKVLYELLTTKDISRKKAMRLCQLTGLDYCEWPFKLGMRKTYYVKQPDFWYEDSERHKILVAAAAQLGIELKVLRRDNEWSHEELLASDLIIVHPQESIPGGYDGKYDYSNGCEECGKDVARRDDMAVEWSALAERKLDFAWVGIDTLIVSEKVKNIIVEGGFTGARLRKTVDVSEEPGPWLPCFQLEAISVMPAMDSISYNACKEWKCTKCGSNAVKLKGEIWYLRQGVEEVADINKSLERRGPIDRRSDDHIFVVRQAVYSAFKKAQVRPT